MITDVDPVTFTDEESQLEHGSFKTAPWRWRREERPESQLTDAAAVSLLMTGRLKQRDLDVLRAVWMYGVMSTSQIRRLVFHTLTNRSAEVVSSRRLSHLYKEHCLNRAFRGLGSEFIYTLDLLGARIIQMEQRKRNRRDIKWSFKGIGEKLLLIDHSLGITEFGVTLTEAAREYPGGGGLRWWGEHVLVLKKPDDSYFNPDGMGILRLDKAALGFFLEWDRGTETPAIVGHKVKHYIDYLRNPDAWRGQFSRFPVVLIATTTEARVEKILVEAQRRLQLLSGDESLTVLVTTHEALSQQGVLNPVWHKAGATEKIDLAWGKGLSLPQMMTS